MTDRRTRPADGSPRRGDDIRSRYWDAVDQELRGGYSDSIMRQKRHLSEEEQREYRQGILQKYADQIETVLADENYADKDFQRMLRAAKFEMEGLPKNPGRYAIDPGRNRVRSAEDAPFMWKLAHQYATPTDTHLDMFGKKFAERTVPARDAESDSWLQFLYETKTLPAYFTPLAPLAMASDLTEATVRRDPLGAMLASFGVARVPKHVAAGIATPFAGWEAYNLLDQAENINPKSLPQFPAGLQSTIGGVMR